MDNIKLDEKVSQLGDKYRDYLDFFESKSILAKTKGVSNEDLYALGQQLENFDNYQNFNEANGSQGDLGVLPNIALDVITASAAQSAVPLLAAIQPMQEQQGTVYFKNVVSSTSRGNVKNGDTLFGGLSGREKLAAGFAGEEVYSEDTGAKGDGTVKTFTFTVNYAPVRKRGVEVIVEGTEVKLLDDAKGNLIGLGGQGKVNYEKGTIEVTFTDAPKEDAKILITYASNFEVMDEIPTVRSEYESVGVRARTFALRSDIGLFKSYSMSKRFGMNVEEAIAKDLTQELTSEVSSSVVLEAYMNAKGVTEWSKTAPSGVSYTEHKLTFFDALANSESVVLGNAGRVGTSTTIIAGNKAAAVIRTLPGFKVADQVVSALGTHFFGTLDGKPVIRTTVIPEEEILLVSKGSSMFDTSLIYAPYMPLFVTSMFQGQDHNPLKSQKGVALQAGIKAVVPNLITKLKIVA